MDKSFSVYQDPTNMSRTHKTLGFNYDREFAHDKCANFWTGYNCNEVNKVFYHAVILPVLPLRNKGGVYNFHHRCIPTVRDRILKKIKIQKSLCMIFWNNVFVYYCFKYVFHHLSQTTYYVVEKPLLTNTRLSNSSCSSWPGLHTLPHGFWPTPVLCLSISYVCPDRFGLFVAHFTSLSAKSENIFPFTSKASLGTA